jgi:CheY-like chemotaxis protein
MERERMTNHATQVPHVLVIDDDAAIRDVVHLILADAGYTVTVARDGAAALDVLRQAALLPDVMLLDLGMPLIDGRTFRRIVQGNPRWRTIPVVMISADLEVHTTAQAVGVAGVLPKPFTVPELLAAVERYAR